MIHHVKIAVGGTHVLKYSCFWREIHSCGWHARFKVCLLAGHSVPYTDIQYMRACNQLVVHIVSQTTE